VNRLVFALTLSIRRGDGTAGPNQSLDRLPFKPDFAALLLEFPRTQVKLEDPESEKDPLALIISGDLAEELRNRGPAVRSWPPLASVHPRSSDVESATEPRPLGVLDERETI